MKILLIEDDTTLQSYIAKGLNESGHTVDTADNGRDGLFYATTEKYDVIIADRMLPEPDGLTIVATLRGAGNTTPILILSALGEVDDKVMGLKKGADDYMTKPFAFTELLARIEVLGHRRTHPTDTTPHKATVKDLEIDYLSRKVTRRGIEIPLQSREFALLAYLVRNKGQVITRTMLLENVWDYHFDPQTNVIDVHISRLRAKIEKGFATPILKTIRGAGYIIED